MRRHVAITGFGPFEEVRENPSGIVAERLAQAPPAGFRVSACVLPVSFERARLELDEFLLGVGPLALLVALGVHKEPGFRIERRARAHLVNGQRVDVDGVSAAGSTDHGADLETTVAVGRLEAELVRRTAAHAWVSEDAGGFVCESVYHHLLARARELGAPALFVHVPHFRHDPVERQLEVLGALIGFGARE